MLIFKNIRFGSIHKYYLLKGFSAFLNIFTTFLCAKALSIEEFGKYNFIFSTIGVLTAVTSLGLPQLAIRKISYLRLTSNRKAKDWVFHSVMLQGLAAIIFPILYISPLVLKGLSLGVILNIWFICFFNALIVFFSEVLRSYDRLFSAVFLFELLKNGLYLITLIFIILFYEHTSVYFLLSTNTSLSLLTLLFAFYYFDYGREIFKIKLFENFVYNTKEFFPILKESFPLLTIALIGYIQVNDNFILGYFVSDINLSKIGLAFKLFSILIVFTNSTLLWFSPQIAWACANKKNKELKRIASRIVFLQFIAGVGFYISLLVFYPTLINFLGNEYAEIKGLFVVYIGGYIVSSLFASPSIFLTMANKESYILRLLPLCLLLYFFFSFFFYKSNGIFGISCCYAILNALYILLLSFVVKRELGFFPTINFKAFYKDPGS